MRKPDDGLEEIARLKNDGCMIVATVFSKEDAKKALDAGADMCMFKPLYFDDVESAAESILKGDRGDANTTFLPDSDRIIDRIFMDSIDLIIPDIDTEAGIVSCGGSEEEYKNTLGAFYKEGVLGIGRLNDMAQRGDMQEYSEVMHKIGGEALKIGAFSLTELAGRLEEASVAGDVEKVRVMNANLTALYRDVLRAVRPLIQCCFVSDKQGIVNGDAESIAGDMLNAIEKSDIDGIETASNMMMDVTMEDDGCSALLKNACTLATVDFEYEAAAEKLREYLNRDIGGH